MPIMAAAACPGPAAAGGKVNRISYWKDKHADFRDIRVVAIQPINGGKSQIGSEQYAFIKCDVMDSLNEVIKSNLIKELAFGEKRSLDTAADVQKMYLADKGYMLYKRFDGELPDTNLLTLVKGGHRSAGNFKPVDYENVYADSIFTTVPAEMIEAVMDSKLVKIRSYADDLWQEENSLDSANQAIAPIIEDVLAGEFQIKVVPCEETGMIGDSIARTMRKENRDASLLEYYTWNEQVRALGADAMIYGEVEKAPLAIYKCLDRKHAAEEPADYASGYDLLFNIIIYDRQGIYIMRAKYTIGKQRDLRSFCDGIDADLVRASMTDFFRKAFPRSR